MKKIMLLAIMATFATLTSKAQQFRGYAQDEKGKSWLAIDVVPYKDDSSDMYIYLTKKGVLNFAKSLEKWGEKAKEWAFTAERENVVDFEKHIPSADMSGILGLKKSDDFQHVHFKALGIDFDTSVTGAYVPSTTNDYYKFDPFFVVDAKGASFLMLKVKLPKVKAASIVSTETTGASINDRGGISISGSKSKQTVEYEPIGFYIPLPVGDINNYIKMLKDAAKQIDENKDTYKNKKNLFK